MHRNLNRLTPIEIMRPHELTLTNHAIRHFTAVALTVSAVLFGSLVAEAQKTVNVSIDHNQYWAGYHGVNVGGGAYSGNYLGAGGAPDVQGTISASDVVRCAPEIRSDKLFHTRGCSESHLVQVWICW